MWWKYYVLTSENGKMRPVKLFQEWREGTKENDGGSEFNYDIRTRANTTRGLDYEHMIKERAHKGGVRIGKTPKKLASICCP
jgi:hypothetical protein